MKRKLILGVVASIVVATSAYAGDIKPISNDINVSVEKLQKDGVNNVPVTLTGNAVYTPKTITQTSLKNPVLNIEFSNVKDLEVNLPAGEKLFMCEVNTTDPNILATGTPGTDYNVSGYNGGDTPFLVYQGDNDGISKLALVAGSADVYMSNGKHYALFVGSDYNCTYDATNNPITIFNNTAVDGNFSVKLTSSDVTNVNETWVLATGDSQQEQDKASFTKINVLPEYCVTISRKFQSKIDPATGFVNFGTSANGCTLTSNTTDYVQISYNVQNPITAGYNITDYGVVIDLKANNNLPLDMEKVTAQGFSNTATIKKLDTNNTEILVYGNGYNDIVSHTYAITLAVNGKDKIPVTDFTIDTGISFNQNDKIDILKAKDESAGSWTYQGVTVSTPYIVASSDTLNAIRLNNTGSIDAQVYWTCTDTNGVSVDLFKVPGHDLNESVIKANGSNAWISTDILNAARAINPDFAPDGKFRCSALVTTDGNVSGVNIQTINGARDRVIPLNNND